MQNPATRNSIIASLIGLVLIVGAVVYFSNQKAPSSPPTTATTTTATATTPSGSASSVTASSSVFHLGANVGEKPMAVTPPTGTKKPDPAAQLTITNAVSADTAASLKSQFAAAQEALVKEPLSHDAWILMGMVRMEAGDYAGAEADWKYVEAIYPTSQVASDDLGVLYMDYMKNYFKAEAEFKHSIAVAPNDINAYQHLVELYTTYGFKSGTSAAADLVAAGLKANPGNQALLQLQAQLQQQ